MKSIYVMGTPGSGKTAFSLGFALKLREEGLKVSYFKPVGIQSGTQGHEDDDVILMREVLHLEEPMNVLVPLQTGPFYLSYFNQTADSMPLIKSSFEKLASYSDVVIAEVSIAPYIMASVGLDAPAIARAIGASVIMVSKPTNDYDLDTVYVYNELVKYHQLPLIGNIFNNIPRTVLDKARGVYKTVLQDKGFKVLGVIPSRLELTAPTVQQFLETLGGQLLAGEAYLNRIVEDIVVGAMTIESALTYLRRSLNKAVITGGDRAELALAALETSTSVLILTGGLYPDVKVIARAEEKGVPVILVHYDTFTAIEKLHYVTRVIKPDDTQAINLARQNIEQYCDWPLLLQSVR